MQTMLSRCCNVCGGKATHVVSVQIGDNVYDRMPFYVCDKHISVAKDLEKQNEYGFNKMKDDFRPEVQRVYA